MGERLVMSVEVHLPWDPPKSAYTWLKVGESDKLKGAVISRNGEKIWLKDFPVKIFSNWFSEQTKVWGFKPASWLFSYIVIINNLLQVKRSQ